jgi:tRNA (guanine-N7-)-methyltransferase
MPCNRQATRRFSLAPLVPWRSLSRPIPWERVFGRSAPLDVELGFGLGDYLVRTAVANPDRDFVGVEIDWFLIRRTLQKLTTAGITNVALVQAGADGALDRLFTEQSIERAWAMFPCPWPKARHARKRLFSKSFLLLLNSRLVPKGEAFVVTDDQDHAQWILEQSMETGFQVRKETIPPQFATRYEKEWEKKGQSHFYEVLFDKEAHIPMPVKEETSLQTRIVSSFRMEDLKLEPMRGRATVVPKESLYDPVRYRAMVRVLVIEEDLPQDIWIEIIRKPSGWHIRPAKGCGMIPTAGVQEALDLLQGQILGKRGGRLSENHPA